MPYKKGECGNKKGRPKGAKNKICYDVAEIISRYDCNPFVILAQIATGTLAGFPKRDFGVRVRKEAASELAQYVAPKLKAIELSADTQNFPQIILNYGNPNQLPGK